MPVGKLTIWTISQKYGNINQTTLQQAINDGAAWLVNNPDDTLALQLDTGMFNINSTNGVSVNLGNKLNAGVRGKLVLQGKGMNATTLVLTDMTSQGFVGTNVNNFTIRDLHMTRSSMTVTQGIVMARSSGSITLAIQPGFPTPQQLFNTESDQGRFCDDI